MRIGASRFALGIAVLCIAAPTVGNAGAAATATTVAPTGSITFHAAPAGTGSTCSADHPCGLQTAQQVVRATLARTHADTDIRVVLKGGTYRLAVPLTFGPADSGSPGHPVVWTAAPGAHPVLSGAIRVTGWRGIDPAKHIYAAAVPAGSATRQLYVDGREAPVAAITPASAHLRFTPVAGGYTVAPAGWAERLARSIGATNVSRIELVFDGANGAWTQSFCRIARIDGARIRMQQPCWWNVIHRPRFRDASGGLPAMPRTRQPTLIRNAYPFLQPGSWYLDAARHVLYYRAREGQSMGRLDVELPRLQSLVTGTGTTTAVHDIVFSGLTFADATWLGPSSKAGFADVQDNLRLTRAKDASPEGTCTFTTPAGTCPFGALTREPGNVGFSHATRITFTHDVFTHLGAAALVLDAGSQYNTVSGNVFDDIAGGAIILGNTLHPNPPALRINTHNVIANNVIHAIGTDYPSAAAITLFFSQHTLVAHNDIFDVPYDGISAGVIEGHVDNAAHPDNSTNINADNRISDNLIHGFMQVLHDGAAIYIEGHQGPGSPAPASPDAWQRALGHGLQVTGNVAYQQGHANYTWYDDAGSEWIHLRANIEWGGGAGGGQGGCQATGNIAVTDNFGSHAIGHWSCVPPAPVHVMFHGNIALPVSPALADLPLDGVRGAGPVGAFRQLEAGIPPTIGYVQVQRPLDVHAATPVLVAGSSFIPGATTVRFHGGAAIPATVLNNGMLAAEAPAGADACAVQVTTPAGTATGSCKNAPVAFWTKPAEQ